MQDNQSPMESLESLGRSPLSRRGLLKGAAAGAGAFVLGSAGVARAQDAPAPARRTRASGGPDNAKPKGIPYAVPVAAGVTIKPIITVGEEALNGYRLVGIPDGMGALPNGTTFHLFVHHELSANQGIVRAHGSKGAFVSKWKIDRDTLNVIEGEDFAQSPGSIHVWNGNGYTAGAAVFNRLCSADLPLPSSFRHDGLGTADRIFLGGDEVDDGRAWARICTGPEAGQTWELPRLGRLSWENCVASPHGKMKTIVACLDDGAVNTAPVAANNPCEMMFYVGTKQASGNTIEKAGLTNGKLYGARIYREQTLVTEESNDFGFGSSSTGYVDRASFMLVQLGDDGNVANKSAVQQSQDAIDNDVCRFQRIEDGAWDPRAGHERDFYFVTTASFTSNSRLWHVRFNDENLPENGGKIEILLTATSGRMFDNICIDSLGRLFLQEDTGNQAHVAKIYCYGIDSGEFLLVAQHNPDLFLPGGPNFITTDEESSGIIDAAEILGPGWFIFNVESHASVPDPELVQGGQLLAMHVPTYIGRTGVSVRPSL